MAEEQEFSLGRDGDGRPALFWNGSVLGHLAKGRGLLQPLFKPVRAVAGLEGDDLRAIAEKAEGWVQLQLAKHMGGLVALNQLAADAATDGVVRALAARLADAGGIAGRQFLNDTLMALPKEARGAARKAGIVFGALDVYHHAVLKPAAAKWRAALFSALTDKPMPELPPESAVHLKEWNFASIADCRNAGYRKVGQEYVRIDLVERVIKKAHEARGNKLEFAMDIAFATSLGLGEDTLSALMRDAGFRRIEGVAQTIEPVIEPSHPREGGDPSPEGEVAPDRLDEPEDLVMDSRLRGSDEVATVTEGEAVAVSAAEPTPQPTTLTHWRWIGLRKAKPPVQHGKPRMAKAQKPGGQKPQHQSRPAAAPKAEAPPSALALQLAALKEKMGG
jgi:ATP-dependent RNA helicase SUPV3L1/SUV3